MFIEKEASVSLYEKKTHKNPCVLYDTVFWWCLRIEVSI
jgi:hypothetical protein